MLKIEDIPEDQILIFDTETDHQHSAQAKLKMIGVQYGLNGVGKYIKTPEDLKIFKDRVSRPDIIKVGFNQYNFDNIVLERHGYPVNVENCEDMFLAFKTICPALPAYGLKFIIWYFTGDFHEPQMNMEAFQKKCGCSWDETPQGIMIPYLRHDLTQHKVAFQLAWEDVQQPEHWNAYCLDKSQGPIVLEMALGKYSGLIIDKQKCHEKIDKFTSDKALYTDTAYELSEDAVTNPNSSRQMGAYLDEQGFELALSDNGEFAVRKSDLLDIREHNPVAECAYEIRKINGTLKYFENYLAAVADIDIPRIPVAESIDGCRTRRYSSSSLYGINFQNPNEDAKTVHLVPPGWLGVWFDSTQIENVVHIYESEDDARRRSYESDPDWSEYVWLCNKILGGSPRTKKELDSIPSPQVPNWSIYKQFKTAKLALNFGMGVSKFCATTGVSKEQGYDTFNTIHDACPAIRFLQDKVGRLVSKYGYVTDPFGHRYTGNVKAAYKIVAYFIQGCGTASVPKAHMRENFRSIHQYDSRGFTGGSFCSTTHDENAFRLSLELRFSQIYAILRECHYNMTAKFSPKFGGIPLRAKMYLSKTNEAAHIEVDINNIKHIRKIVYGTPCSCCNGAGTTDHGKTKCQPCNGEGYIEIGDIQEPTVESASNSNRSQPIQHREPLLADHRRAQTNLTIH